MNLFTICNCHNKYRKLCISAVTALHIKSGIAYKIQTINVVSIILIMASNTHFVTVLNRIWLFPFVCMVIPCFVQPYPSEHTAHIFVCIHHHICSRWEVTPYRISHFVHELGNEVRIAILLQRRHFINIFHRRSNLYSSSN